MPEDLTAIEASEEDASPSASILAAYALKRADLVRFFTARMNSKVDAEDLIQDLYVKLCAGLPAGPIDNPSAYLYRMAANLMLDRARGARRSEARDEAWRWTNAVDIRGVEAADAPSPEEAAASRQRLRQLVEAVRDLPTKTRRAFELHKFEGLSHAQTARRLGVSQKTVEKQISAALRALMHKLGQTD